jgi:hypothetical protein
VGLLLCAASSDAKPESIAKAGQLDEVRARIIESAETLALVIKNDGQRAVPMSVILHAVAVIIEDVAELAAARALPD